MPRNLSSIFESAEGPNKSKKTSLTERENVNMTNMSNKTLKPSKTAKALLDDLLTKNPINISLIN